jgi:endonuclease-8
VAEGDTILRARRRLERAVVGDELAVTAPNPRGRAAGIERLSGRVLERIDSHGKNLVFVFGDLVLHSHMGMSGAWHVYLPHARWARPQRSAWAVMAGPRATAAQFGGPTLRVLPASRVGIDPQLARLGPDILAADFDPDEVLAALRAQSDRALGDALLNQHLVAGIGNIFKSEACWAARLDPWRRVEDLSDDELRAAIAAAREQMLDAVRRGRKQFAIYRRRGPCPRCGGRVRSRGQGDANRTTYWCERCQV